MTTSLQVSSYVLLWDICQGVLCVLPALLVTCYDNLGQVRQLFWRRSNISLKSITSPATKLLDVSFW